MMHDADTPAPQTPAPEAPAPELSWRKRHPVFSRVLLYSAGLGLAIVLTVLYLERKAEDEARQADVISGELDLLEVVHAMDQDGSLVLKLLDEKFAKLDLTVKQQGRALRWRAMALRKQKDAEGVEAAFAAAEALDIEPLERAALHLEWAEARIEAGDNAGALKRLPKVRAVAAIPQLMLLRALLFAQIKQNLGSPAPGLSDLREALATLPPRLEVGPSVYVGGRPWLTSQAATVAIQYLMQTESERPNASLWRRLHSLAWLDFEAQVICTRGFLALGLPLDALDAWKRARELDPALAKAESERDPSLKRLQENQKALQSPSHPGR